MKKLKILLIFFLFTCPVFLFGQSIYHPQFESANDKNTILSSIEVTPEYTIVTFENTSPKGAWIQMNKSMYLQDANKEDKYEFIKSENIPLRPEKYFFKENDTLIFKVYFEKLKPGTTSINIIERALSEEQNKGDVKFMNYFGVSLEHSRQD